MSGVETNPAGQPAVDSHAEGERPGEVRPQNPLPMTNEREAYDAGLLNDYGGGNVEWWQDYIRAELARAHDHFMAKLDALRPALETGGGEPEGNQRERIANILRVYKADGCSIEGTISGILHALAQPTPPSPGEDQGSERCDGSASDAHPSVRPDTETGEEFIEFKEALSDLRSLRKEYEDLNGGGPNWTARNMAAWAKINELFADEDEAAWTRQQEDALR